MGGDCEGGAEIIGQQPAISVAGVFRVGVAKGESPDAAGKLQSISGTAIGPGVLAKPRGIDEDGRGQRLGRRGGGEGNQQWLGPELSDKPQVGRDELLIIAIFGLAEAMRINARPQIPGQFQGVWRRVGHEFSGSLSGGEEMSR